MAEARKMLTIDTLRRRVVDTITVDGKRHDVLALDFATHEMLEKSETLSPGEGVAAVRRAVKYVVPTLTDEEIGRLEVDHAQQILMLANSNVEVVEKMFPNAVRPETTSTSPG